MTSPIPGLVGLALCLAMAPVQAQRVAPAALTRVAARETFAPSRALAAAPGRPVPAWLKWGLVGAGAGAVTFPLLGGLSDSNHQPARDAALGAAAGFVIVGGAVALWQGLCGPDSASRRAGMCGR